MANKYFFDETTLITVTQALPQAGSLTLEAGGLVIPPSSDGFDLGQGVWTIAINGTVSTATGDNGMSIDDSIETKRSTLSVGAEGTIYGGNDTKGIGLLSTQAIDIKNAGLIQGDLYGIKTDTGLSALEFYTITNGASGEIVGGQAAIINTFNAWQLTVKNAGTISGTVDAIEFDGSAVITNTGKIDGDIKTTAVTTLASVLTNSATIDGAITLSHGDDVLKNTGSITGLVDLSDGKNALTNGGTMAGGYAAGLDADIVKNTGTIGGLVQLGDGDNSLTNSGIISGNLTAGAGNDTVKNTGTISGTIDLGGGNDSFTGGNGMEIVLDAAGIDSIKLGGGDDQFNMLGLGSFTVDGGAGTDTLTAAGINLGVSINLDTQITKVNGVDLAAQSAFTTAGHVGGTVKGFESVIGSTVADLIAGGKAAESLSGLGGDDFLAGGGGADKLTGGTGADTFVFLAVKDSGLTRSTRDTVTDFKGIGAGGTDKIDLSAIDANTKLVTNQSFSFKGADVAFNHVAGELRTVTDGPNTLIQGDVNGDAKADFSITLVGTMTLQSGDFAL